MTRPLLTLAILLPALAWAYPATTQAQMIVTSYNIRYANPGDGQDVWANRKSTVAQYLADKDLVGLQEVTAPQFEALKAALPEFTSYGVGRDDGESGGEHAPIFYRTDRFEAIDQGTFWLSEDPEAVGKPGWDAALPRTCTWMILKERSSEKTFCVANTHFDHRGRQARLESGKLLAKRAGRLPEDLPIILTGDFNCQPDSEPYHAITAVLSDARKITASPPQGPNSTWNGFQEITPDRIIDHVFVRSAKVLELHVDNPKTDAGRFGSDHLPVRAVIEL